MTTDNHLYLGIDGGGTKTQAIIKSKDGQILGRGLAGGSNPHNLPESQVISNILEAINQAAANLTTPQIDIGVLGIAGLDSIGDINALKSQLSGRIQANRLILFNDGLIGLKSGTDSSFGICIIASTGSNCFGINQAGDQVKAGDWGYMLGDQGSGFAIGQKLIKLAVKEHDGRKPETGLFSEILNRLELNDFTALTQYIYQDVPPIQAISSLAKMTSDDKFIDNQDIIDITHSTVSALFESFEAVILKTKLIEESAVPVVLVGKLFLAHQLITKPLTQLISAKYPQFNIIIPQISPVEAAANLAINQI